VLEKVGHNSYKLILPPYMHVYSVLNVENPKLYEPSMLSQGTDEQVLPTRSSSRVSKRYNFVEEFQYNQMGEV
jgi:hypothetical protein